MSGLIKALASEVGMTIARSLADRLINGTKKERETAEAIIAKVIKGNAARRVERELNKARAEAAIAKAKAQGRS